MSDLQGDLISDFSAITTLDANTLQIPFLSDSVRKGTQHRHAPYSSNQAFLLPSSSQSSLVI